MVFGLMMFQAESVIAVPLSTAFTYQGHLYDANRVADGLYDFQFKLFDDPNVIIGYQVGSDVNVPDLDVIDSYFTVVLDFNDANAFNGDARWLEIGIRPGDLNDPNVYTFLEPRQAITPTPYALKTRGIFVDESGNVGIGTTSPAYDLDVNGDIRADSSVRTPRVSAFGVAVPLVLTTEYEWVHVGESTKGQTLRIYGRGDNGALLINLDWNANVPVIRLTPSVAQTSATLVEFGLPTGSTQSLLTLNNDGTGLTLKAEGTSYFAGKVGIGTTSPQGTLDVNGTIYQRGGLLHADYVFEPGYELESIEQHSESMWQNKHLPAIPEARVDEAGREIIEIGSHHRGIVEELEKAHIYIEQLHNQNKTLEERVTALEKMVLRQQSVGIKEAYNETN